MTGDAPQSADRPATGRWLDVAVLIGPVVLWLAFSGVDPWGDEAHFLVTVRLFGDGLSLDRIRSYPEMTGPLSYVFYAWWGHLAGFNTPRLRLLSAILSGLTGFLWVGILRRTLTDQRLLLLTAALTVLNPYFVGLSIFVFTDMLALFGLVLVLTGVGAKRPWLTTVGVVIATCTRQHFAFLPLGLVLAAIACHRRRPGVARALIGPAVLGMVPLAVLAWLWRGLAPVSPLRDVYTSAGLQFDLHALSLYLAAPAAYLLPLVLLSAWPPRRGALAAGAAAAVWLARWPVQPSIAQTREGSFTVGFLDRLLTALLPGLGADTVFLVLASLNAAALANAAAEVWRRGPCRCETMAVAWAGIVAFLAIMPFSYMPWEKYAVPLVMLQGLALAGCLQRRRVPGQSPEGS